MGRNSDMSHNVSDSPLANLAARAIQEEFNDYHAQFKRITRRARLRFCNRDWQGMRSDSAERLDLYRQAVNRIETNIRASLADRVQDRMVWVSLKAVYSGLIVNQNDWELAETFFNSVTRRVFATVGVDPQIEFVDTDFDTPPSKAGSLVYRSYGADQPISELIQRICEDYRFQVGFRDLPGDSAWVAERLESKMISESSQVQSIDMINQVFHRGMGAYLIGRLNARHQYIPLVIALHITGEGIQVDAVLLDEDSVSILFSFTHSYFHVEPQRPYDLVRFLKTIMPRKRIAEIYSSIGYNKHGKTELYRNLLKHTATCGDVQFHSSPGKAGMVMIVFNLPDYDLVFKLIRDRFRNPKNTTRREVMDKYEYVFMHDRAGRLLDAQSFEYLEFDRCWFSDELLDELQREAAQAVVVADDHIIIKHVYVERQVIPLDLYLRQADAAAAQDAVLDYGRAIKDMAVSNIFPGDMLLKNFGVTRHGRVVFYDYDEICPLLNCNFRKMPQAASHPDEFESEPWFYVDENDVFPEEFQRFIGLPDYLDNVFRQHHSDLYDPEFWRRAQDAVRVGDYPHIFPYDESKRRP